MGRYATGNVVNVIFGFSKPISKYNVISAMIRAVSKREFSHSYVRFIEPTSNDDVVFQASGLVVNIIKYSNFLLKEIVIEEYSYEISNANSNVMLQYIIQQAGTNYGVFQLFLDLFYIVFHIKLPFKSTGEVCSEQSARLAQIIGLKVPGDLSYYTPSEFQEFCSANMKKVN